MDYDLTIRQQVEAQLAASGHVDGRRIGVACRDGILWLTGRVRSQIERRAAEAAAQSVAGVDAVVNDIVIGLTSPNGESDADIAAAAIVALKADPTVPRNCVKIVVHDGCVELQGCVNNWQQKQAAENAVMSLKGIKSLVSDIMIHATSPADSKSQLLEVLRHTVSSGRPSTPGVCEVVEKLRVLPNS